MRRPRRPRTAALGLAMVLLTACGSGAGSGGSVAAPPAAGPSSDLSGVCPDPVVVQTNWFPQSEHGAVYQLLGPGYQLDAGRRRATGPLVTPDGHPTGVRIQVRAGGPAVNFQSSAALMYQDPAITLGMLQADEVIQLSKTQPVVGVAAPLELDPQILLWDPQRHPDWNIIADIGQTNAKVLYFQANTYMDYLVGAGILRRSQVDGSYDGSPSAFVASGGAIAVQGYATNEPYTYQYEVKQWKKPVKYQLVYDTGYPNYGNVLAVRADRKQALAPCLKRLVPMLQRAQVAFMANPEPVINTILKANDAYKGSFVYTAGNARFAVEQLRRLGIVDNGPDRTLGNFDPSRLERLVDIVGPILAAAKKPIRAGLEPDQVGTNEFVDPRVRLP